MKLSVALFCIVGLFFSARRSEGQQRIETVEVGSNRYFLSDTTPYSPRLNWFLAYQYCRSIGMDLLSMPVKEEADLLKDYLSKNDKSVSSYWMSGNQLGSHMWIWMTSGQPLNATFNFWDRGGPTLSKTTKSCMYLQNNVWSATDCMDEKAFICQLTRCYYFNYAVSNQGTKRFRVVPPTKTAPSPPKPEPNHRKLPPKPQPSRHHSATLSTAPLPKASPRFPPPPSHNEILPPVVTSLSQSLLPPSPTLAGGKARGGGAPHAAGGGMRRLRRKEEFSWAFVGREEGGPRP